MAVKSINTIKSYLTEGKYPTASELVNVIDTLVSIGQNSGGDTSGLADVAVSGDYNDLTNKPTVPTISTNIANDATSDTKTASPKAVKDFVEGKGYLTEHQDISGKANQTDLEALEDRVETLEQGGSSSGDTTQYSYLKLIPDLDAYTEAPVGEIVMYIGQTNDKYKKGGTYEKVSSQSSTPSASYSWQPVIMPSNVGIDTELSSSSNKPVENATLYNELRIEEAGSVLSVNGTNYPIVELDATDFDSIVYTGAGDTDFTFKVIPTLDSNKAYIIKNANFDDSKNDYSFSNQGTFIVKFQSTGSLSEWTSVAIGHNKPDAYNSYQTEGTEFNKWLSIPATYQFNVTNWGGHDNDTTIPYYGTSYEDDGSSTITELTNATETTGSASVIKSLKAKVMELEAQIAQISTQLQNIASN